VAAEQVTEQVAQSLEEAARGFELAARDVRRINVKNISLVSGGLAVGVVVGFYFGYRWNKEKIRAEEFRRSEEEIATMRAVYQAREARHEAARTREAAASTSVQEKPAVDDLVKERGYTQYSATSGASVVEERPLPPPVPGIVSPPRPVAKPIDAGSLPKDQLREEHFSKRTEDGEKDKNDGWVYAQELTQRSPNRPYIIHQDEFAQNENDYQQVTYTYYAGDDTLTDEDDTVLNNRENLIGVNTLRWGHGADDINLVHIRNPQLELEFEICRTPKRFEEEVLGLQDEEPS
jgi:hypothetical protein